MARIRVPLFTNQTYTPSISSFHLCRQNRRGNIDLHANLSAVLHQVVSSYETVFSFRFYNFAFCVHANMVLSLIHI